MLGARLFPRVLLMAVASWACAGGGEGPSSSSAFDPTQAGNDSGTTSSTGPDPDDGMTTPPPPGEATGDPPPGSSCCEVSPTPGCSDAAVEMCVCTIQPSCCQSVWSQQCVDIAIAPCEDPACGAPGSTGEPGDGSSSGGPPTLSCDQLAAQEGWTYFRCQDGDLQCNGMGTPTTDCDYCCGYCNEPGDVSCGDLATSNGWAAANCEWNGNGACGGQGTPTCDCNFCCEVN